MAPSSARLLKKAELPKFFLAISFSYGLNSLLFAMGDPSWLAVRHEGRDEQEPMRGSLDPPLGPARPALLCRMGIGDLVTAGQDVLTPLI
jgi:hypothetical protein